LEFFCAILFLFYQDHTSLDRILFIIHQNMMFC